MIVKYSVLDILTQSKYNILPFKCADLNISIRIKALPFSSLLHVKSSAAKPDPFFRVEPNFGPKIRVESGRVGPQDRKTGPIGSGWSQKGFKFGHKLVHNFLLSITFKKAPFHIWLKSYFKNHCNLHLS